MQKTKFKQTEIGEIPEDWDVRKLREVASKSSDIIAGPFGSNLKVSDYKEEGIPIIRLQNIERFHFISDNLKFTSEEKYNELKYHSFIGGDIVLAKLGDPIGKTCIVPQNISKGIVVADVVRIRTSAEFTNKEYILYVLNSFFCENQLRGSQLGSTRPRVNLSDVRNLLIPIPPLKEQEIIGKILSKLDSQIEVLQQQNETLEAIGKALFKHWFVDFEFPNEQGKPYKSSGGAMVDNELGEIPKGWKIKKISDVADVVGGGTPSTAVETFFSKNGIPWLSPRDLSNFKGKFIKKGAIDISEEGLNNSSAKKMPEGTVLFSSRAPIGYCVIAENEITTSQGFKSFIPKEPICSEYLFQFLKSNINLIISRAHGSTFKEVSGGTLKAIEIIVPTDSILMRFKNSTDSFNNKIRKNQHQETTLSLIRNILLPKLMTGKIRVQVNA